MTSSQESSDSCSVSSSLSNISNVSEMLPEEEEGSAITPWRFEPVSRRRREEGDGENSREEARNDPQERLQNIDWCVCENCQVMDREVECVCCQEILQIKGKLREAVEMDGLEEEPACINAHPGFLAVCTNRWVLQSAWYQYRQYYGGNAGEIPLHKRNRHIAYRQLVRRCWGVLGKEIRVVLPACAVMCIRAHFPPPGLEEDFIFTGFKYSDE